MSSFCQFHRLARSSMPPSVASAHTSTTVFAHSAPLLIAFLATSVPSLIHFFENSSTSTGIFFAISSSSSHSFLSFRITLSRPTRPFCEFFRYSLAKRPSPLFTAHCNEKW